MDWPTTLQATAEVALAMVLGGLIGVEREIADKPAGLRTHMLVAGASALFTVLGKVLPEQFETSAIPASADPIRIIQAIVVGVSFLGAGTIMRRREIEHIEGLTTAATILLASAIGITVVVGGRLLAVIVTGMALFVLLGIKALVYVTTGAFRGP